jgi:hypothetical protein
MTEKQDYLDTLGDGLDSVSQPVDPIRETLRAVDYVALSTNVVLHIRPIAPRIIMQVLENFKAPKVPSVYDKEKERAIENPQDPAYLQAIEVYQTERGLALLDACIALGTELETIPEGVTPLDSEDWIDELAVAGVTFDASRPRIRYAMWVKTVAAVSEEDLLLVTKHVMRLSGVTKEDVDTALNSFRS